MTHNFSLVHFNSSVIYADYPDALGSYLLSSINLLTCIFQKDGTYMFNFEGFIPKLCPLAQEMGEDDRAIHLRAAALQALFALVFFMHHTIFIYIYIYDFS